MKIRCQRGERVGQPRPVRGSDPAPRVVSVGDLGSVGDMVEVAVGQQDGGRSQFQPLKCVGQSVGSLHPGVDDDASVVPAGAEDVTIGRQWTGWEGCDHHGSHGIGQDGGMSEDAQGAADATPPSSDGPIPSDGPKSSGGPRSSGSPWPTSGDPASFGRVADDGTVYLRTSDGERPVGQVPDVGPDEALAFYVRRYTALELEVSLLERRVRAGNLSPDDAAASVRTVRESVRTANAVGDLDALSRRLDALAPVVTEQRAARKAERAKQQEETRAAKERFVAEAERLAQSNDWRGGVNRFRSLLDQWKQLPRLDRATDDALWHRFSSARTTYTRRRKAQFAHQAERREQARLTKESIIGEAEALADSTDWGPTTGAFRELMSRWKAAGPAPREVEEDLWQQFRGIQDRFFAAKQQALSEQDAEFRDNQVAKEALLDEAEKLVPVTDLDAAKAAFRDFLERWAEIGKVPRDAMRGLDGRLRAVEKAIRDAEEEHWRRTNPEARARAEDTAAKLEAQIASLEERATKADSRGDAKAAQEARDSAATYREWLTQAQQAADEFRPD